MVVETAVIEIDRSDDGFLPVFVYNLISLS